MTRPIVRCLLAIACALVLAGAPPLVRSLEALLVLARLTGQHALDPLAERWLSPVVEHDMLLPAAGGALRARRYTPRELPPHTPGVLLLHGVHPRGIDEPHLVAFARALAAGGLDVVTPELPELLHFQLDQHSLAQIRQAAAAHAATTGTRAVGAIGISFAGGLALLAAAQQASDRPIGFVVSVGGHADLLRLCQYYAGVPVRGPDGQPADVAPHPYGARVMIREHLDRFFVPADLPAARQALDSYLSDRPDQARRLLPQLTPAGQGVLQVLLDRAASPALSRLIEQAAELARPQLMAASPAGKLGALRVPVLLIHGEGDPIIPSIETRYLAREVPRRWLRQTVITPLLRHTEFPAAPALGDTYELVRYMKNIYEAAGSCVR